jgi:hypothetical protein
MGAFTGLFAALGCSYSEGGIDPLPSHWQTSFLPFLKKNSMGVLT